MMQYGVRLVLKIAAVRGGDTRMKCVARACCGLVFHRHVGIDVMKLVFGIALMCKGVWSLWSSHFGALWMSMPSTGKSL